MGVDEPSCFPSGWFACSANEMLVRRSCFFSTKLLYVSVTAQLQKWEIFSFDPDPETQRLTSGKEESPEPNGLFARNICSEGLNRLRYSGYFGSEN